MTKRKAWAGVEWNESDIQYVIDNIVASNEGYDKPFDLVLSKEDAAEFLDKHAEKIRDAMIGAGMAAIRDELLAKSTASTQP